MTGSSTRAGFGTDGFCCRHSSGWVVGLLIMFEDERTERTHTTAKISISLVMIGIILKSREGSLYDEEYA